MYLFFMLLVIALLLFIAMVVDKVILKNRHFTWSKLASDWMFGVGRQREGGAQAAVGEAT
jgi:hypothetical protein